MQDNANPNRNSTAALVQAAVNILIKYPPPPTLNDFERKIWQKIVITRAAFEWAAYDFEIAIKLCKQHFLIEQLRNQIETDGTMIDDKPHPLFKVVASEERIRVSLERSLSLHIAVRGDKHNYHVAMQRALELHAREINVGLLNEGGEEFADHNEKQVDDELALFG